VSSWADGVEASIRAIAREQWAALGGDSHYLDPDLRQWSVLAGPFGVTQLGAAAFATVGAAVAELLATAGYAAPRVAVDVGLASAWLTKPTPSVPDGWERPSPWSDVSLDYPAADGRWVRLQANYPHLRRAVGIALAARETPEAFAAAIGRMDADTAERLIVDGGGAAAATRTVDEWAAHPQGAAVAAEPLVDVVDGAEVKDAWRPRADRPLSGLRVLDVTRVLAGPTATRFLAGLGAEVLRIDPEGYAEPHGGSGGDLTVGKRCANLALDTEAGRRCFLELLGDADIFVHGLRAGALDGLGLGPDVRAAVRPGLIDVTLNAYGWSGPWAGRRGFDTLVQTSAGYSTATMRHNGLSSPRLLPAQVLDIATGYLIAAAAIRGATRRLAQGRGSSWRLSLARTARHILPQAEVPTDFELRLPVSGPVERYVHWSPGGPVRRLKQPLTVGDVPVFWEYPGDPYGSATPRWVSDRRERR
jgi:crotonobetainyl-CoA:carnitine CoA-transferase CaiB-like acyl-CoA transferase